MQSIVLTLCGQKFEARIGFECRAFVIAEQRNGNLSPAGHPLNPGRFTVELFYIAMPDARIETGPGESVPLDWWWYAETASNAQIVEMFDARDRILAMLIEDAPAEIASAPAHPEPEIIGAEDEQAMAQEIGGADWLAAMGGRQI